MNTIAAKYELSGNRCYYCGITTILRKQHKGAKQPSNLRTIDHMIPICRGGTNELNNYVESCFKCNAEKGQLTQTEYFIVLNYRKASRWVQIATTVLLGLTSKILVFTRNSA